MTLFMNAIFTLFTAIWFFRFLIEMGVPKKYKISRLFQSTTDYNGERLTREDVLRVLFFAFLIRILIYFASVLIYMVQSDFLLHTPVFSRNDFFNLWTKSDAQHYLDLAEKGYAACTEITEWSGREEPLFLVFFPLYPWFIRFFHLFLNNYVMAAFAVSIISFCVGCVFFYGAVKEEYGTSIAEKSITLLLLYPFSFFFGGIMTESLFFCLISAGFFYIRRHKWPIVGLIGILASLCRIQGAILLGVGMVEFLVSYQPIQMIREKQFKDFLKHFFSEAVWLLLIPIGNLLYLWLNYQITGNAFQFTVYQKNHWYHTTTWFTNCVTEIMHYISGPTSDTTLLIWYPELILFFVAAILFLYSLRTQPLKYSAYLLVYTLINYSVTFLISGGRYMLNALPLFFFTAALLDQHKMLYKLLCFASALLYGIYFTAFLTGGSIY